jgi:DNA-binding CsgD family transcriptional regulator
VIADATRAEIPSRYEQYAERFDRAGEVRRRLGLRLVETEPTQATPAASRDQLSGREQDVLELIAAGLTDVEIGRNLTISEFTVKSHIKRLPIKLGARNRAHAVAVAVRCELLALAA